LYAQNIINLEKNLMFTRRALALSLVALALAGCASVPAPVSVADSIAKNPSLSTLDGLLGQAGLNATLQGSGPFTVFAPSNEAFKAVPAKTMDDLAKHPDKLKDLLTFHVVAGRLTAAEIKNSSVKTVNGAELALSKAGEFVTVEQALVQTADIAASNGVIHIIDSVLIPPPKK